MVGHLGAQYNEMLEHLNGRLAQVTDVFWKSGSPSKIAYNNTHNGVVLAAIVDRFDPNDRLINRCLGDAITAIDSDDF